MDSLDGLSGIKAGRTMFLVGMFTSGEEPLPPAPATLDYTIGSVAGKFNFDGFNPLLNQVFFIGDGRNQNGNMQFFNVPAHASRLYLGFADGNDLVGFYDDNLGELSASYEICNSILYQNRIDAQPPVLNQGKILHYTFDDLLYTKPVVEDASNVEHSNLADVSGFGFHGVLAIDSHVSEGDVAFTYENPKYGKAVQLSNNRIRVMHPSPDESGLPLGGDWSAATWFVYDAEHPNFSISHTPYGSLHTLPVIHMATNPGNNHELSTIRYVGDIYPTMEYEGSIKPHDF